MLLDEGAERRIAVDKEAEEKGVAGIEPESTDQDQAARLRRKERTLAEARTILLAVAARGLQEGWL